jgi:type I restriction enzyme M protein
MDWDNKQATKDPYDRYKFGIPPGQDKVDFAFIQHMYSSLNETGQVAVICSQGVLFRGNEETRIRENMIEEDIIEAIIALPQKLFYGTGIPGCVLVLNKNKHGDRKNTIICIYAVKEYQERKVRNLLRSRY